MSHPRWTLDKPDWKTETPGSWGLLSIDGEFFELTTAWNGRTATANSYGDVYVYLPRVAK